MGLRAKHQIVRYIEISGSSTGVGCSSFCADVNGFGGYFYEVPSTKLQSSEAVSTYGIQVRHRIERLDYIDVLGKKPENR